jgi:hypothetical protein
MVGKALDMPTCKCIRGDRYQLDNPPAHHEGILAMSIQKAQASNAGVARRFEKRLAVGTAS